MKRLICVFLVFLLLTGSFCVNAESEMQSFDESKIGLLSELGIWELDTSVNNNEPITRLDFAITLAKMVFYKSDMESYTASKQLFYDVGQYHYAAGYLEYLYNQNIISGYEDGNFGINDPVALEQAYKMLLAACGYSRYADVIGSYPHNYYKIARDEDLTIEVSDTSALTRCEAAELFYQLLDVNVMDTNSISSDSIKVNHGGTFSEEFMDLKSSEGVIRTVGDLSLIGKRLHESRVLIGNQEYNCELDIREFLGYNVKYYYTEYNDIVAFIAHDNKIITISSDNAVGFDGSKYSYYRNDKTVTARISSGYDLMYNGIASTAISNGVPAYGQVTLIDNNDDSGYDVIIVEDVENYFVDRVNIEDEIIFFKNLPEVGKNQAIKLEDYDVYEVFNSYGTKVDISRIRPDTLISVVKSGTEYIKVVICNEKIEGNISSISSHDSYQAVTVSDEQYNLCSDVYTSGWDKKSMANDIVAYLDIYGNIGAVVGADTWRYAYLINVGMESSSAFDTGTDSLLVKLLDEDGNVYIYNCAEKFYLDGHKINDGAQAKNNLQPKQLIRYIMNNGKVKKIDTSERYSFIEPGDKMTRDDDTLLLRLSGTTGFKPALMGFRQGGTDGEVFPMDKSIPIFSVPAVEDEATAQDYEYTVINIGGLAESFNYTEAYNTDPMSLYASAIVLRLTDTAKSYTTIVVDTIYKALDDNGEHVYKVEGFSGSSVVSMFFDPNTIDDSPNRLEKGDIIQVYRNKLNYIGEYKKIYTADGTGSLNNAAYTEKYFDVTNRFIKGTAKYVRGNMLVLNVNNDEFYEMNDLKTANIYVVEDDKIRQGKVGDINDEQNYGVNSDTIVIGSSRGVLGFVVVYKNN